MRNDKYFSKTSGVSLRAKKKKIDKNGETFSLKFHYFIVDFAAETFELYFLISMF